MGNNSSRVAPTKSLHILDTQTRTRYKNQRESNNLRRKLQDLRVEHNDALSRITFDEQDIKIKLHELQYDKVQRDLFRSIDKRRSTSKPSGFNVSHLKKTPVPETSSLLLHNLYESREQEKSNIHPEMQTKKSRNARPLSAFEKFQLQYSSKADMTRRRTEEPEKTVRTNTRSLQKETEQMKKSIKASVAKASRDSNMFARRDTHVY